MRDPYFDLAMFAVAIALVVWAYFIGKERGYTRARGAFMPAHGKDGKFISKKHTEAL